MIKNKTNAAPRGSIGNPCETLKESVNVLGNKGGQFIWVKAGTLQTVVNPGLQTEVTV